MVFVPGTGPSNTIVFPQYGPYDERLGYAELPHFITSLSQHHFTITRQARWSPLLRDFVGDGGYAIYHEKEQAGLSLYDQHGTLLYGMKYPESRYLNFASIPPVVVATLSFIEDRDLFASGPKRNPAVDWARFGLAVVGRLGAVIDRRLHIGGASTLATQLEKFRHSPEGRTPGAEEKLRQMLTASIDAYQDGPDTLGERQRIITAYLNSEPLGSRPGYGEIIGVPDALWRWYGTDLTQANLVLTARALTSAELARQGQIYRQVLSLLLAGRRPGYYLVTSHQALTNLTDRYLRVLADAGIISSALRDAAARAPLRFREDHTPPPVAASFLGNKAADRLRAKLVTLLQVPDLYALDRIDLNVWSSIEANTQRWIEAVLGRLGEPTYDRALGLYGKQLLGRATPARVAWSVVLYERGAKCNFVRVRADSVNEPFDLNSGAKLQLGSTAKLRTLITYLDIVEALHRRLAALSPVNLEKISALSVDDPITRWAANWLSKNKNHELQVMLEAAMQRTYSASPGAYFTGGGMQSFANFAKWEDHTSPTVATAFANSVNNSFVRLLRDIVNYEIAQNGTNLGELLNDRDDPERLSYLRRFADQEGGRYVNRFWREYRGLTPQEALDLLASRTRPDPRRLAVIYRSVAPHASRTELGVFLAQRLPRAAIGDDELWDLYRDASPDRILLRDRGYVAGIHPLELWLVAYLQDHPNATHAEIITTSAGARQEVYRWLFESRSTHQQNLRIRILLEEDAFDRILEDWQRQGYPFGHLVPSDGTAIGSSGDRPDALAELMGIIVNGGVRLPTVDLERLDFALGTPYETEVIAAAKPQRVLAPEVARTVQRALSSVVAGGTATAVSGVYRARDGSLLPIGGKTGTGDNRYNRFGRGGRLVSQTVVDRTATFVFYLGSRFYGTITASVPGAMAAQYDFSSALAVHLLRALEPELKPLLDSPVSGPADPSKQLPTATLSKGGNGPSVASD